MDFYLIRHAVAFGRDPDLWPDDSARPLTPEGEERFGAVAARLGVPAPARLLSSPYARAWRTAEILREVAGWPEPEPLPALEPDVPPEKTAPVLEGLAGAEGGPVALVGHRPNLHELAAYLLCGGGLSVKIKKGGLLCVRLDATPEPAAELRWLLTPAMVLRMTDAPHTDPESD